MTWNTPVVATDRTNPRAQFDDKPMIWADNNPSARSSPVCISCGAFPAASDRRRHVLLRYLSRKHSDHPIGRWWADMEHSGVRLIERGLAPELPP
jgi:hypothetical protein